MDAQEIFDGQVAARFAVTRHEVANWPGGVSTTIVVLNAAVTQDTPENARFADATPWGELRMAVTNPLALIKLQPGREFVMVLTPATPRKVVREAKMIAPDEFLASAEKGS